MEISIKWNVCRVCLVEERRNHAAKYTPIDTKIAKQIHEIAGVEMDGNDNLPDKICRKCLVLLKYACHFSTTCRNSDEYLQSIIRKTKSAASMLKMDKRNRSSDLIHEIFDCDTELPTIHVLDEEQEDTTMDVDLKSNEESLPDTQVEKIEDTAEGDEYITPLIKEENPKIADDSVIQSTKELIHEEEQARNEFLYEDYQDNELENYDDTKSHYNENNLEAHDKAGSMNSLDYADDDAAEEEEAAEDTLDVVHDQSDASAFKDENQTNDINNTISKFKQSNVQMTCEKKERETETGQDSPGLYYVIKVENPVNSMEDAEHSQNVNDESINVDDGIDVEEEENLQVTNNLSEAECYEDGSEEHVDENSETYKSIVPLEEYLIDESDAETTTQEGVEPTKQISSTTIKINVPEQHSLPNERKRLDNNYTFSCEVCGNNFASRSLRNYHMRIHRSEKKFECELCFKRFTAACNLTAHMRIHTGEKPYQCKYCFRRFTDRSTHIKHERIHTNEKPFQCTICTKSFALSTTLRTHEKVHTNEKPFKCAPCNKSFKLPHQLKAHVLSNQHKNMLMSNDLETLD